MKRKFVSWLVCAVLIEVYEILSSFFQTPNVKQITFKRKCDLFYVWSLYLYVCFQASYVINIDLLTVFGQCGQSQWRFAIDSIDIIMDKVLHVHLCNLRCTHSSLTLTDKLTIRSLYMS